MSDVKMALTAKQYVLLMDVVKALPRALSSEEEDEDETSMPVTPATASAPPTPARNQSSDHMVNLEPELSIVTAQGSNEEAPWNAMDFVFDVGSIALEVYDEQAIDRSVRPCQESSWVQEVVGWS
jgi:vacuolar protein sorting-associated protein 13A/C